MPTRAQGLAAAIAGAQGNPGEAERKQRMEGAQQMALQKYLKGTVGDDGKYSPGADQAGNVYEHQGKSTVDQTAGDANFKRAQDALQGGSLPDGSGVSFGANGSVGVTRGFNPNAGAQQGAHQAQAFIKAADAKFKPINDQLNSSKATLDALDQGNSTSDKLALINEARLAAGQGGSRAISHMVDILSGGSTAASDFQGKINWLQNTPNIPTLQPAQRDAIRESVFQRLPQIEQMGTQTAAQLAKQGPTLAPSADTGMLLKSYTDPAMSNLNQLKDAQANYTKQRQGAQNPVSQPATANPNPTTLDKLRGFFGGGQSAPQAPQAPQAAQPGGFNPDAYLKGGQ